jgi:2-amino-4-hydroxy-6-hydroxymethyldihydropteridine diphosphokinase
MSQPTWTPAYIGIGSNLDDPRAQVLSGIDALANMPHTRLVARSKLYRSAPMGPQDQPHYVNAVAGLITQLDAPALLAQLKFLEKSQGREQPVVRWGPRVVDFDLLVFGSVVMKDETLTLPHPGISERSFVLLPMMDVAPDLNIPSVGRVSALAARVDTSNLQVL